MKFKLDENLGNRLADQFRFYGHDVETVFSEGLVGSTDSTLFQVCQAEERILITLDLDFADVLRFPVEGNPGTMVLRPIGGITGRQLAMLADQILKAMPENDPTGRLWIVEPGRIRVHGDRP